jgi:hypothetical protein
MSHNRPSPHLVELAESCVDFVHRALSLPLDYTQDTLPILDHYLRVARKEVREAMLLSPLVPTAGAYFGVLLCQQYPDARFVGEGADYENYRVEFGSIFLHVNPVGIAQEVLTASDAPGFHAHFSMLEDQRLIVEQTLTEGLALRDDDYYSFSVRYEMLDHVVAVLAALEGQRADGPRSFGPEVYAAMLGEKASIDS